jgi:Flp pilus assembly protein TadD
VAATPGGSTAKPAGTTGTPGATTPPSGTTPATVAATPGGSTEKPAGTPGTTPPTATPPAATGATDDYARLLKQGTSALAGERFVSAAKAFRGALAAKPDSIEAKAGLGVSLVNQGTGYKEAILLLKEAVKADDANAKAWLSLGMAQQFTGANNEAREAYKKYLLLAPTGEAAADVRAMLKELGQ